MKKITITSIIILILIFFLIEKQKPTAIKDEITFQPHEYFVDGYFFGKGPQSDPATTTSPYPTLNWKNKSFTEKSERVNIDINYPQFEGSKSTKKLNDYIKNFFNEKISERRKELSEAIKDEVGESISPYRISFTTKIPMISVKNNTVSLELVETDYSGGGNGNHSYSYPVLWDLKTDKPIKQDQLFCSKDYLNKIAPVAQKIVLETIENHPDYKLDPDLTEDIKKKTEPVPENFEILLPYNNGLIAVFQPYVLLGGAAGTIRIFIPESEIPGLLCI